MKSIRILKIVGITLFALLVFQGGQAQQLTPGDAGEAPVSYANPAAIYCMDLGYNYTTEEIDTGSQGICTFDDGLSCDAWDFLNGKCGQAHNICAQQGLATETRDDGNDMFSPEYAVCVDAGGKEVASAAVMADLERRATEGCGASRDGIVRYDQAEEPGPEDDMPDTALPSSFDWRSSNKLTNVRDQGGCGSCWAFSAVGVTEAALNIANGKVGNSYDLSEQYINSDCHSAYGYQTCCGGWKDIALTYIRDTGIPDEACMPYVDGAYAPNGCQCNVGSSGKCESTCTYGGGTSMGTGACSDRTCSNRCTDYASRLVKISTTGAVGSTQTDIKTALINKGPIAVSLRMSGSFDGSNVYRCSPDTPSNHAVVIVGYNDAGGYWIVRNSWGSTWGPSNNGYFNVGYGECDIEHYPYYATVTSAPTPTKPTALTPNGTTTDRTPKYRWTRVPGATHYQIQIKKGTSTILTKTYAYNCTTAICGKSPAKTLQYNKTYKWRVRAKVGGVWKTWSSYKTFNVIPSGFYTDFNYTHPRWKRLNGTWKHTSGMAYYSAGIKNKSVSIAYKYGYRNGIYQVRMGRTGCNSCAQRIFIRGKSKPLSTSGYWNKYYSFQYTNNGYFSVWEKSSSYYGALIGWTKSSAIKKSTGTGGQWNVLKVIMANTKMKFYINNKLVAIVYDSSLTRGELGIGFYRDSSSGNFLFADWARLSKGVADEDPSEMILDGELVPGGTFDLDPEAD